GYPLSRPIYYFARKDLLRFKVSNWLLPRLFTIPVDRDGPSDVAALKRVFSVLKEGAGLLVFPEGTRTLDGNLQPGKPGVGMLACKVKVPVVPARVYGTFESFGKHHK